MFDKFNQLKVSQIPILTYYDHFINKEKTEFTLLFEFHQGKTLSNYLKENQSYKEATHLMKEIMGLSMLR